MRDVSTATVERRPAGRPRAKDDPKLVLRNLHILADHYGGLKQAEIARKHGISVRQVRNVLTAAKRTRRRPVEDEDEDEDAA
jgi:transposase